ncbi:5-dehydro-4-deoxy-D-glucuronate isomerase [Aliishimia ponticola]|uniref:4-deoxy-L-threo-5-hexosulose-uronate ketol-isomerase n=1 Tax=Aliishimia ponticola TaxID=2499833 RepID=A0A4S4NBA3_9RHOB|nr:5-dehydro-4-deoxy-D-glucuronate isomerase [Aliishimia ponticola]THH36674.1 5-dehydro-4-deoxy-D-glucuronate isomerase [Aliishimia ponticola]
MLTVEIRHAVSQNETRGMDTTALRSAFHAPGLFAKGEARLVYTHYDRMIVGGIWAGDAALVLDEVKPCGTASILDRREIGILNIGAPATVSANGVDYQLAKGDILYLGKGEGPITFAAGGRFYIVSTPAHQPLPAKLVTMKDAAQLKLGSAETANDRTLYQFIHPAVMESCQLVMGYTVLHGGSVWNSMPTHTHDRRMEAYFYFDMEEPNRVFHMMGEPDETRHIVMKSEEAVISPPWSIHCGCGTGSYTFCWAMAGDNVDFTDVDPVALEELR